MKLRSGRVTNLHISPPPSLAPEHDELLEMKLAILILEKAREVCQDPTASLEVLVDIGIDRINIPRGIAKKDIKITALNFLREFSPGIEI
tara:strand:+ start:15 stop:284 length:270 start_codon:yes stop_codon:yes gene_type:complete